MQGNSVPLDFANINYPSSLFDMPLPSTEGATNVQGGSNSGGFLSGALSNLSSLSSSVDLGKKHEGNRVLQCVRLM